MAAMSAAAGTTTITPPSSSYGYQSGWKSYGVSGHYDDSAQDRKYMDNETSNSFTRGPLSSHDGNAYHDPFVRQDATDAFPTTKGAVPFFSSIPTPPCDSDNSNELGVMAGRDSTADGLPGLYANERKSRADKLTNGDAYEANRNDENSKWIHRDKLARIESEELQAAGIILPKSRSQSRPRREPSSDKLNGHRRVPEDSDQQPMPTSRKVANYATSEKTLDLETSSWDLRRPEEVAEDPGDYWVRGEYIGPKPSRIPVAKGSPAPIPVDYLERDAPAPRKISQPLPDDQFSLSMPKTRSRSGSFNALEAPKTRSRGGSINALDSAPQVQATKRSATDGSPRKKPAANGTRKTSTATKPGAGGRSKTRSGLKESGGSISTRPTTRSGELSPTSKSAPEGDPPWMMSSFKPDPRLPPDQQLLPTVAKRLQQEQWEKEGKFGNVYDKEFRPLTDEGYLRPPQLKASPPEVEETQQDAWPLRQESKSSSPSRPGTSSYSTMPRIQNKPPHSPMASPGIPAQPQQPQEEEPQPQPQPTKITRIPEPPEEPEQQDKGKNKEGCGCCIVM